MEQISFDDELVQVSSPLDQARDALHAEFEPRLIELGDMRQEIGIRKNSNYLSIQANSSIAARIYILKKGIRLEVKDKHVKSFPGLVFESKNGMSKVSLSSLSELLALADQLCTIAVDELVSHTGEGFGCCSLYEKCSDTLRCIQPMQFFSLACAYRKNLESGRVFYGKNKNI